MDEIFGFTSISQILTLEGYSIGLAPKVDLVKLFRHTSTHTF
jgi:hypothetical protein